MRVSTCAGLGAAVTLLAGCASNVPTTELIRADLAIDQATTAEANQYAPTYLSEAQRKLEQARVAAEEGSQAAAEQLAREALASAQLAVAETESLRVAQMVQDNLRSARTQQDQERREATR